MGHPFAEKETAVGTIATASPPLDRICCWEAWGTAIAYGFMGSQALFAALELGLFTILSDEPCTLDDLAKRLGAPAGPMSVLLSACVALDLLTWDGQCYSNRPATERFLVSTARSYVGDYYLRQVSAVLYNRMHLVRCCEVNLPQRSRTLRRWILLT